jgi:hypothetical protein
MPMRWGTAFTSKTTTAASRDARSASAVIGTNADCDVGEEKPAFLIEVSDELGETHVAMVRAKTLA